VPGRPYIDAVNLSRQMLTKKRLPFLYFLKPDLVVITGDIINWGTYYIEPVAEVLGKIKSSKGAYAIMGNHDFYGDIDALCGSLEKSCITVLRNRWVPINFSSDAPPLYLIGVDDIWATRYFKKKKYLRTENYFRDSQTKL
jgi:predicted MPP superfamily phosphohydrolase